jgi:hypothetical protein
MLLNDDIRLTLIYAALAQRVGCAYRATPPLPFMAGEPTEKSLFLFQKISAG